MAAYYNEFKPEAAHMLRQLIKDGLIAPGEVDERSIVDVRADDLRDFTQCHFFAGIGGWSVALRQALWSDDRPVWTGSCPCQPFSAAGKQKGHGDERHLWPYWFRLIRERRPATIFGEQVAAAITYGWWDDVAADLEAETYACGATVLPACSVGNPHKRDRLWFVGHASSAICKRDTGGLSAKEKGERGEGKQHGNLHQRLEHAGKGSDVANSNGEGLQGHGGYVSQHDPQGWQEPDGYAGTASLQWITCPDGKARPVKPGICLLANGVQHRTPILHAFGNAIVPQVAAEFIKAAGLI